MKSIHEIFVIGVFALCVVALSIGPPATVQAEHSPSPSDTMKTDSITDAQKYNFQSDDDKQRNASKDSALPSGGKTIHGELFRVDDADYFVKVKDGTEVRLHTDKSTNMIGKIKKGDQIEATVNDQNHALSIQAVKRK
ncbi:MAG TPA: hypothetical protein VLE46_15195 [Nitrospira sp.]|nr:hypothetical protein [Nitrospira sp.]